MPESKSLLRARRLAKHSLSPGPWGTRTSKAQSFLASETVRSSECRMILPYSISSLRKAVATHAYGTLGKRGKSHFAKAVVWHRKDASCSATLTTCCKNMKTRRPQRFRLNGFRLPRLASLGFFLPACLCGPVAVERLLLHWSWTAA